MPCRCWYFTIVFALFSVAFTISTHLCRLSPFLLTYVAVSRPCRLSEFYHNRVQTFSPVLQSGSMPSIVYGNMSNLCLLILLCSAFNALILPRICQGPWSTFSRGGGGEGKCKRKSISKRGRSGSTRKISNVCLLKWL